MLAILMQIKIELCYTGSKFITLAGPCRKKIQCSILAILSSLESVNEFQVLVSFM